MLIRDWLIIQNNLIVCLALAQRDAVQRNVAQYHNITILIYYNIIHIINAL